jgi:hypothetical protein
MHKLNTNLTLAYGGAKRLIEAWRTSPGDKNATGVPIVDGPDMIAKPNGIVVLSEIFLTLRIARVDLEFFSRSSSLHPLSVSSPLAARRLVYGNSDI